MVAILLTRPKPAAARFATRLRNALGEVEIVETPLLKIVWVEGREPGTPVRGRVFSSVNGVEGVLRQGTPARGPAWCVGTRVAEAAEQAGFNVRAREPDAEHLIARILADKEPGPLRHLRGVHQRGDIADRLTQAGCSTYTHVVYDQIVQGLSAPAQSALKCVAPVILPLFSPRTARQFATCLARVEGHQAPLFIAAMSDAVVTALGDVGAVEVQTADFPDAKAMCDATEKLFDAAQRLESRGPAQ